MRMRFDCSVSCLATGIMEPPATEAGSGSVTLSGTFESKRMHLYQSSESNRRRLYQCTNL
jgi:hypothetical protein